MKGIWIVTTIRWIVDNIKGLCVGLLVALGMYAKGRRSGRKNAEDEYIAEHNARSVEAMKKRTEVEDEVRRMHDDDRGDRMRDYYRD